MSEEVVGLPVIIDGGGGARDDCAIGAAGNNAGAAGACGAAAGCAAGPATAES